MIKSVFIRYKNATVDGSFLPVMATQDEPAIQLPPSKYPQTILMWDPDAGNPSYIHWMVVDIPPGGTVKQGQIYVTYQAPAPPKGTGKHRYYFAVFDQVGRTPDAPMKQDEFIPLVWQRINGLQWTAWNGFSTRAD